jgi:hypothetical protein
MLTIFTTPKPFRGHISIIQRNALKSWTLLRPRVEVILFGKDEGAADAAREFGIRHEPYVQCNDAGMKHLDYMFRKAQAVARHDVLCYVNCDIILTGDFRRAIERVHARYDQFLMVGHRWDTPITAPIDFSDSQWEEKLRKIAFSANDRRNEWFIDYFVFSRDIYGDDIPPFVIGTVRWDNWLIWKALDSRVAVVDASPVVAAVHQNHDYSYHPQGKQGVWNGEEAQRNHQLAGGWNHLRNISDATYELRSDGRIRSTWSRRMRKSTRELLSKVWYRILIHTYSVRSLRRVNREGIAHLRTRLGK